MTKRDYSRADIYTIYNKFREPLQNDKKKGLQPEEATKIIKFVKTLSVVTHSLSLSVHMSYLTSVMALMSSLR